MTVREAWELDSMKDSQMMLPQLTLQASVADTVSAVDADEHNNTQCWT